MPRGLRGIHRAQEVSGCPPTPFLLRLLTSVYDTELAPSAMQQGSSVVEGSSGPENDAWT